MREYFHSSGSKSPLARRRKLATAVFQVLESRRMLAGDVPVAQNDTYLIDEDGSLNVPAIEGVLANDTDAESDPLAAVKVTDPANGTLTLNADGSFTYTPNGNFNGADSFTYKANDGAADSNVATVNITVNAVNDNPTLDAIADPAAIDEDAGEQTVNLTGIGVGAVDEAGQVLTVTATSSNTSLIPNPTVTYTSPDATGSIAYTPVANANGTATITVTVTDDAGGSFSRNFTVAVNAINDNPTATADDKGSSLEDAVLSFPASELLANDTDVDVASNGQVLSVTAVTATGDTHGTVDLTDGVITYTPDANYNGPASFEYTLSDGTVTTTGTVSLTVTAVNDAPALDAIADPAAIDEDAGEQTVNLAGIGVGTANEVGQELTVTAVSDNPGLIADPTVTYSSPDATGTLTYTPVANAFGTATITVTVTDNGGTAEGGVDSSVHTFTITVDPVNDAPVAVADAVSAQEDQVLNLTQANLKGNDTDVDNTNDQLTVTGVNNATNGTVVLNVDGTISFTPDADFSGEAGFDYTLSDGNLTSTAHVTVTVNATPTLDAIADPAAIDEDAGEQTVNLTGIGAGSVAEAGQILTVTATSNNTSLIPNPTVTYASPDATGSIAYTPVANASGTAEITVTVSDDAGGSFSRMFTVTVNAVNDLPVPADDSVSVNEDAVLSVTAVDGVTKNDFDMDGDSLTAIVVTGPSHGILTLNADGSFSYTPEANFNGVDSFTYKVNDGTADSASTATVTITVNSVNDEPTLDAIVDPAAIDEEAGEQTVNLSGIGVGAVDEAGQDLTVTATSSNPAIIPNPTVTYTSPDATGTLTYTPVANAHGTVTITVTVTDNGGTANGGDNRVVHTFTVTVNAVNDAPVAVADSYTTDEDTALIVAAGQGLLANDTDIDGGVFSGIGPVIAVLIAGPAHGSLDLQWPGSFTYTPNANFNGADSFTYRAEDGASQSGVVTVNITVNAVQDAPVARTIVTSRAPGQVKIVNVQASSIDVDGDRLSIVIVGAPLYGAAAVNNNHTPRNTSDDYIVYKPDGRSFKKDVINFKVSDGNGGEAFGRAIINVKGAGLVRAGKTRMDLVVLGTAGDDTIRIGRGIGKGAGGTVNVILNGKSLGTFNATGKIIVEGMAGDDAISASPKLGRGVVFFGGAGNDSLSGSSANDALDGGDGNDLLQGYGGTDSLVGGPGKNGIFKKRKP